MSDADPEVSEEAFAAVGAGPDDDPEDFAPGAGDDWAEEGGFGDETPGVDGGETGSDGDGLVDRLMSTEPDVSLGEVDPLFDPEQGGFRRLSRGVRKATPRDAGGVPAVVDLLVGAVEVWAEHAAAPADGDGADGDGADGLDGITGDGPGGV